MNAEKAARHGRPSLNTIPTAESTAKLGKTVTRDGHATCATCGRRWAGIRNLTAVAAIHARAHGHRVDMALSVRVTFAPARRGGGRNG